MVFAECRVRVDNITLSIRFLPYRQQYEAQHEGGRLEGRPKHRMECTSVRLGKQKIILYQKTNDTISCLKTVRVTHHTASNREGQVE